MPSQRGSGYVPVAAPAGVPQQAPPAAPVPLQPAAPAYPVPAAAYPVPQAVYPVPSQAPAPAPYTAPPAVQELPPPPPYAPPAYEAPAPQFAPPPIQQQPSIGEGLAAVQSNQTLREEKATAARNAFRMYDKDRSGFIDCQEWYQALRTLGLQISWEDACAIFAVVDLNGNGSIGEDEFVEHWVTNH